MTCYERMLGRLQAEDLRSQINALLATNGQQMRAKSRDDFMADLDAPIVRRHKHRPPKPTAGFLRDLQAHGASKQPRGRR